MDNKHNFHRLREKLRTDLFSSQAEDGFKPNDIIEKSQKIEYQSSSSLTQIDDGIGIQNQRSDIKVQSFKELYQIGKLMGEGAHAVVRQCWAIDNPDETFAVKITRSSDPQIMDIMKQTFLNSLSLEHQYVIKTYKLFIDPNNELAHMIMEYLPYPSLQSILKEKKRLSLIQVKKYIRQLLEAVEYIHKMGICHRDIKPDNILIDEDSEQIKLIDFGVSKRFIAKTKSGCQTELMWTVTGNMRYSAPELWQGSAYRENIDIWAVGVVGYQMLLGKLPIDQESQMDYSMEKKESYSHILDEQFLELPIQVQDFFKRLLRWKGENRISAKDALNHPWLYINRSATSIVDDLQIKKEKNQYQVTRSMQATLRALQLSVQGDLLGKRVFGEKVEQFKTKFQDNIFEVQKLDSQQFKDKIISFQQSITSCQISGSGIRNMSQAQKQDAFDFFDKIKICDSSSSLSNDSISEIPNQKKSDLANSKELLQTSKLGVIKEEPETPIKSFYVQN